MCVSKDGWHIKVEACFQRFVYRVSYVFPKMVGIWRFMCVTKGRPFRGSCVFPKVVGIWKFMCVFKGDWYIEAHVCLQRWLVYSGSCVFQKVVGI